MPKTKAEFREEIEVAIQGFKTVSKLIELADLVLSVKDLSAEDYESDKPLQLLKQSDMALWAAQDLYRWVALKQGRTEDEEPPECDRV